MRDIQLLLTDEQRFVILELFWAQTVRVEDYPSAVVWKEAVDALIGGWQWGQLRQKGMQALAQPDAVETIVVSREHASIISHQLLAALGVGMSGGQCWAVVGALEVLRSVVPDAVAS